MRHKRSAEQSQAKQSRAEQSKVSKCEANCSSNQEGSEGVQGGSWKFLVKAINDKLYATSKNAAGGVQLQLQVKLLFLLLLLDWHVHCYLNEELLLSATRICCMRNFWFKQCPAVSLPLSCSDSCFAFWFGFRLFWEGDWEMCYINIYSILTPNINRQQYYLPINLAHQTQMLLVGAVNQISACSCTFDGNSFGVEGPLEVSAPIKHFSITH